MRCKLTIKFTCRKDEVELFKEQFLKIDPLCTYEMKNDLQTQREDGVVESTKGMTVFMDYKFVPRVVDLIFCDSTGVYLAGLKLFGEVPRTDDEEIASVAGRKWSDEEVNILTQGVSAGLNDAQLAGKLGRTEASVESKRRKLKLSKKLFEKLG